MVLEAAVRKTPVPIQMDARTTKETPTMLHLVLKRESTTTKQSELYKTLTVK